MENFAKRLRELRIDKGLSQREVSTMLNLSKNAVGNYELGLREPSLEILKKICDLFDVPADYLIGLTDSY